MNTMIYRILLLVLVVVACEGRTTKKPEQVEKIGISPRIVPNYKDVVIPVNIAPLNFYLEDYCSAIYVEFCVGDSLFLSVSDRGAVKVGEVQWRNLLQHAYAAKKPIEVTLTKLVEGKWLEYNPFQMEVKEEIDSYISYRLIPPGYESWDKMEIHQRALSSFDSEVVVSNKQTDGSCVNCHTAAGNKPNSYVVHSRGAVTGTLLVNNGQKTMLNAKIEGVPNGLTYPSWHPSGAFIAFSSNKTAQFFHAAMQKQLEVYDLESDIVLFNCKTNSVVRVPKLSDAAINDTYPQWSSDGNKLYFCRTTKLQMPEEYKRIKYMLCSIDFNAATGTFADNIDTVLKSDKSIVFPQTSPCGRFISFTQLDYGCFPIWHEESDILLFDIEKKEMLSARHNSDLADSYHRWSSNGKWLMFTSRRDDNWHTKLYFTYISETGESSLAFVLPEKTFDIDYPNLYSYNVPQFLISPIAESPRNVANVMKREVKEIIRVKEVI